MLEASPTLRHNLVRQRIATGLREFIEARELGLVVEEMDFRLSDNTVRNPTLPLWKPLSQMRLIRIVRREMVLLRSRLRSSRPEIALTT